MHHQFETLGPLKLLQVGQRRPLFGSKYDKKLLPQIYTIQKRQFPGTVVVTLKSRVRGLEAIEQLRRSLRCVLLRHKKGEVESLCAPGGGCV